MPLMSRVVACSLVDILRQFSLENYDLHNYLRQNWSRVGESLRGKIHVATGDMDTYYLEQGVFRFEELVNSLDDPPADKYSLTLGERARASLRAEDATLCPLEQGEISLHHIRTAHRSHWNRNGTRRIGFVLRFITPSVRPATAEAGVASLVRGSAPPGRSTCWQTCGTLALL